jgi:hypothetical protein
MPVVRGWPEVIFSDADVGDARDAATRRGS